jgi:hypothetical protein
MEIQSIREHWRGADDHRHDHEAVFVLSAVPRGAVAKSGIGAGFRNELEIESRRRHIQVLKASSATNLETLVDRRGNATLGGS